MSTLVARTIGLVRHAHKASPRPAKPGPGLRPAIVTRAELAECTCPDACERDHEND